MNDTPASGERVQKYVFNFEIYRFAKKAAKLPHPPLPNLVSIAKNFLEPEYPSRINFSGLVARSLHPTRTATTKTYMLGKHACDLQVWHQRSVPSGL